jgi:tetratricopeptide (TPR) repeat protein
MPVSKRAASLRAPARNGHASQPPPSGDRPSLRLAVTRGALGMELDAPFALPPLVVRELALTLPGLRFPVDLSGGVSRFRHRRGELSHLGIEVRGSALARWAAPRLRGVLAATETLPEVVLAPIDEGVLVGMRAGGAVLAFEVVLAPADRDLRFFVEAARGIDLGAPPHLVALRALGALSAGAGRLEGGAVLVADAVAAVLRELMPACGARVPSAEGVRWEAPRWEPGRWEARALLDAAPPALGPRALSALELAEICGEADAAAWTGDLAAARRLYLMALERAPRHPEVSRRLAAMDLFVGNRAEAALATLVDAMPAHAAGILGAELLAAAGDAAGARGAWIEAAAGEPYGPLAALAWLRAAEGAEEPTQRLADLDQAVARAPSFDRPRLARLEVQLDLGDARAARGDAEHLEAAARGPEARHAVWLRVAGALASRGWSSEAIAAYERALRFAPASAAAVTGLGRALRDAGERRRSLDLFARAVVLAERRGEEAFEALLELARGLAEVASDLPAAIARVRRVPPDHAATAEARLLEGRWRAQLGDLAGAAQAFGQLRAAVDLSAGRAMGADEAARLAALLVEAATIEEEQRDDPAAAQLGLALAMRLRPRDRAIGAAFRRVASARARGARAATAERPTVAAPPAADRATLAAPAVGDGEPGSHPSGADDDETRAFEAFAVTTGEETPQAPDEALAGLDLEVEADGGTPEDEALVQQLSERLRAEPGDEAAVLALGDALARLGRDMELLALLSARIEEGGGASDGELRRRRRDVLGRLAAAARAAGRADEASLYESMRDG